MNNQHISYHDRFIRHMMTKPNVITEFFQSNLPDKLKSALDFKTIQPEPESFIDDKLKLQITDLLYSAKFNRKPGFLYLLVEHLSSSQRLAPFRLLKYMIAIMQQHLEKHPESETLPLVVPMIVYAGRTPYTHSTDLFELFDENKELAREILFSPYPLKDLTQTPDAELEKHIWYGTMARVMKHIFSQNITVCLKEISSNLRYIVANGDEDYTWAVLTYMFKAGEIIDITDFRKTIVEGLSEEQEKKVMNYAEMIRQEGMQQGMQQGMQKGRREGRQEGTSGALEKVTLNLLKENEPLNKIIKVTGLSQEKIEDLKRKTKE